MNITKQITVIDKEKVKVGDVLKIKRKDSCSEYIVTVVEVDDFYLVVKYENGLKCKMNVGDAGSYYAEKVELKTSKFATGQLYRVEDTYSCDKFDVLIMAVSNSKITAIKLKSTVAISINEDDIDSRYRFTKIKTVEDGNVSQRDCEFKKLCFDLQDENNNKPLFSGYKPSQWIQTKFLF